MATYMMNVTYMARAVDYSAWHAKGPVIAVALIVVLAIYGTWAAIGGRSAGASTSQ
jgi:hypothetical protein